MLGQPLVRMTSRLSMCAPTLRRMWFGRILWLESVPDVSTLWTEGTVGLDTLVGDESGGRVTPWTLDVGSGRRKGKQRHGASLPDLRRRSCSRLNSLFRWFGSIQHARIPRRRCCAVVHRSPLHAGQHVRGRRQRPPDSAPTISQETLSEMVGTTRSRVNFFLNKFRKMGFIEYQGERPIKINSSLLSVVLHD